MKAKILTGTNYSCYFKEKTPIQHRDLIYKKIKNCL